MLSPEAEEAYYRYARGILEGDLAPLADYLAAGHPMDHAVRKMLVELIDARAAGFSVCRDESTTQTGNGVYKLELTQLDHKNNPTALERRRKVMEDVEIVTYFVLLPRVDGAWDAAVKETAVHFGCGTTRVKNAIKAWKDRQDSGDLPK
ncbi:MAG: hypothetical protein M3N02_00230 [Pseudomonadota bacterium]|nr:hypothetical protein [Pseudomonadota bacterium]